MDSPDIDRNIRFKKDEREESHVRTFIKWINSKLSRIQPKLQISNLYTDLRDGNVLISLLEVLIRAKLPREKGKLRVHHVANADIVLKTLEKEKVKLYGISGEAIVDGNHKSTLGLVWSIILHYQVQGAMKEDEPRSPSQVSTKGKPATRISQATVEDKLLRWVQGAIEGYDDEVKVNDLSKSWRDGMAFNVLIHVHRDDLFKLDKVEQMSNNDRLEHAFNVAEEHLNVQKLLEPSDVNQNNPDPKLVMMYVSSLYESLRQYEPIKRAKRRKVVEEFFVASAASSEEASIPDLSPSEPFVQFKTSLVQTSTLVQTTESDFATIQQSLESRIDVDAWENYEARFQTVESDVEALQEQGITAINDSRVPSFEGDEIQSDLRTLEARLSSLRTLTESQRERIISFQNDEEKELQAWQNIAGIFRNWVDAMDDQLDNIEAINSQGDINVLGKQTQELQRLGQAVNSDPVPRKVLEFGRSLIVRNVLSVEHQSKVKEQLIDMEKELEYVKVRVGNDIDRLNGNIDALKQTQTEQLGKWHKQAEAMCDWLDGMDDQLEALEAENSNQDIKSICKHLEECENLQEIIKNDQKPHLIVEYGEALQVEKILSKDQKTKIEKQLKEMNNEWKSLLEKAARIKALLNDKREASELEEKHKVEEWIRKFEVLLKQMTKVKQSIARAGSLPIFNERHKAFQNCVSVVESIKPEYQNAVECAAEVISSDACPDWERSQVNDDVELLKTTWISVLDAIDEEQKSINETKAEAASEQIEKIQIWRGKYREVDKWYEKISPKVEGNFTIGKTLPVVRKQIAEQEEILNEMVMTHDTVEYLLSTGQELLQDPNSPEAEKNKLRKDIANLVERWESLSNTINNRMQRLSEMEKHFQENLAGKLEEWSNQANSVEGWLTKGEKKFQAMGGIAPNLEAAMKQKPRAEAMSKEMKQEEKKLSGVLRLGEEILADASLSEEDKAKLQQELNTLKNRWEALDEKINWRIQRLNETISRLGSQQDDKLEKWRENATGISDWLDKAQLRLAERSSIGSDLKSVGSQKEEFQVFLDESLLFQRHIHEFTEFGENLRTDPCISEEQRVKVQQKTKSLNERWDVIVQQINSHHNAVETRMDELEEKHQNEKLAEWKTKSEPLQKWLTAKAIEAKSLKGIGNDILTVQRQHGETKVLKSRVENYGKQFREILVLADEIQKDSLVEDEKAKAILEQGQDLTNRWSALKHDLEGRIERLSKKEKELLNEKLNKVTEWGTQASLWKDWLKKKEGELESQGPVGTEPTLVKKQKIDLESLVEEIKLEKTNFDEVMTLADEVLAMKAILDEDRRQIQQDKFAIKSRWDTLHDNIDWKRKRLGNKETELDSERLAKIQEWKSKATPLQEWLKKVETKCDDLQSIADSYETVTTQINQGQILIADIEQKEKQLNIILRLGENVLQSSSLSDDDRTTLRGDSAMLKERWGNFTEKVQSSVKSLLKKKNDLEEVKRARIEEWRATAAPIEEWLAEESNKFDAQGLAPGANLDLVKKKRQDTEIIFNEMLANEKRLTSVVQLNEEIQKDPSLSVEDKRKVQQEMNKIKTTWKNLEEKMETVVKRITNKESDLEKERENHLAEWHTKRQAMEKWIEERENKLQNSGEIAQDLDSVRKQIKSAKGFLEELHTQLKEFRILSRFGDEAQTHPSLYEQDRETVRDELTAVKARWRGLEENMNERLKRLAEVERSLLEQRTNDLAEWKDNATPVKDWISKQEKKIQSHGVIRADHDSVVKQRDEVEAMSEEAKTQRSWLAKLESVHEKLCARPSLSEDDKKKLQQDLNSIKNNWSALEENIYQTHKRICKQESNFHEERVVKIDEWRCKSAPLEQLFNEQGSKWEDDDNLVSSDLETLRKYKLATQVDVQTIQKQQVELENAIRLGDEVQKHMALRDEDRSKVRMEISSLKSKWQSLEERMHKKVRRLSSKESVFNEERSNRLANWRSEVQDLQDWLAKEEKRRTSQGDPGSDLESVRKHKIALQTHLQEIQLQEKHLQTVIEMGTDAQRHASMSEDDRKTIQQDITLLENAFKTLTQKIEERLKRVLTSEKEIQDQKDIKLEEWRNKLAPVEDWLASESKKLETDSGIAADLYTVTKQRREMEDIAKEMELQEKKQLTGVIRFGDDLKTHVTLSAEDRRMIHEDVESLKSNWENLREKMDWKIKRLSEKEKDLKEQGSGKLQEWKNAVTPLQEWLSKEEQKLQSRESLATDMTNLRRQNQEDLALSKELELQQKRVTNVASFGEEIAQHPSVSEEHRKHIEQCIVTVKHDWERLNEKVNWRLASADEKMKNLEKERAAKLREWSVKQEALQTLLTEQENVFKVREGIATDLETVKYKKSEVEDMLKELELEQKKELNNIIQFGEDVFNDPSMSSEDNRKIKQEIGSLKNNLENLEEKMKWRAKRLSEKEKELEQFRVSKLAEWKTAANNIQQWLVKQDAKFQSFDNLSNDLDEVRQQKTETETLAKEMETEKNELNIVVQMGDQLLEHPSLFEDDKKQVEQQLMAIQTNWDALLAKITKKVERITSKEAELDIEVTRISMEWRNKVSPLREWISHIDKTITEESNADVNMDTLRKQKTIIEAITNDVQEKDEELSNVVSFAYKIQENPLLSVGQKGKIQEDSTKLKQEWDDLEIAIEEKTKRLNGNLRSYEQEQHTKLSSWREMCKPLSDWLDQADHVLSLDNNNDSDIETTRRQRKKVEALLEETTSIGPKFVLLKETADSLQQDPCLSQEERNNLRHEAENLSGRYSSVVETSHEQKSHLEKSLEELESQYQGAKLAEWDQVADPLTQWIKVQEQTLESLQEGADDLSSVRKQQEEAEVLASDVSSYNVEVESVLNLNDKLCEDPLVQDEAADVIIMQAKNIKNKWRNLNEKIQARSESLSMKLTKLLNERQRRLAKWNDKVSPIAEWLTEKKEMLASPETASFDIDSARKQKNEIVDLIVDLETQKESLEEIGRVDIDILSHPSIPEEERKKLKQDLVGLQNTADNLTEKGQRRAERLKETVKALEAEQKEKLGEWQNKMKDITNALKNAEKVVTETSVVGADIISTVKIQKETFQGVLARCMEFQSNIYEFTNLGDNLRADPCISGEEKVNIAATTDALNKRWDLALAQLKTRSKALEEQLDVLEENHKTGLLNRWEEKYAPFSLWLNGVENEIKSLKDIANNAVAVRKQHEETKILMSKVANQESAYKDVISVAQTINDDPLIEDSDATTIEKLASSLASKWDTVNDALNTRSDSLLIRESFLSEQEQHLLHEWRRNVQPFNNWLSKVEEDGAYELNGNVGVNSIRDYSVRFKTLEREVEGRKPVLEEIEKLGGKLIADVTVRDEEKAHIQEEMEILQERWEKLHVKIHDNTKWADIKLIELAKKEQETLDVWKKNVEPFNAWLEETNGKLEEIQNTNTDTENLQAKHASLQRIKEDLTRHEEALARIVTIVGKLTDDENLSETEKNNIKAEMNRLQDKWNTTQNNVNLNYLSVTEALMELAQKERATLERWKKQTDPFKEWIVEAKGRLDNILHPREEYDAVLEQKEKLENLSREIVDKEEEFGNICQLKDSIIQDDHLSNSFKDNIKNEGDSFDQKWKELCDSVVAHSDRTQRQMVSLDDSQRTKLEKWQHDFKILTDQQNETEGELKTFETLALDVDKAKKQISDLKVVEQKVEITRSRVEEVSSFCTEISSDSNISKKEKTRIKKDMELVKERQTRHEKAIVEHQRRLDIQIRELQDQQSAKLEKWKTSSQPLHEWLDGIEDDAKEYDVIGGSIADVQVQFDELQKLVKEFKETESDLFNVLKLGEELSTDPQVSQDVRESVVQDITFLKEDHQNVDELLKFQREKMKSQLLKLQQHQEKCLIDWNQTKSSVGARVKTMEKRTGQFKPVGDDMDEVRSQKDDIKTTEKELESIEWELATVLEYGETLCKDKSIFDEEKELIRTEMDSMETTLNSSRNNVEERKLSLNSKMDELRRARANEFLTKWRTSSSAAVKWMDSYEEAIHSDVDDRPNLAAIRERLDDLDELSDKIEAFEPEFSSTVKCGGDVVREPSVDGEEKEKVETELSELKERWKNINLNLDNLMNRLEDQEAKLSKQHDQESAKWYEDVQETRDWCKDTQIRLKNFEEINDHSNYDELSAHRNELQIIVEMLPKYQDRVRELAETSQELSRNSKNKTESESFIHENEALQKDFNEVKQSVESSKSNHDAMIADLETVHGQQLSEWNKKGERIEQQLINIENKWQQISHLENSNDEQLEPKRPQLQDIVLDLNNLQLDYDRHSSVGHQLSKDPALSSDTRTVIEQKLSEHAKRWETLQISRRLLSSLPRLAVVESVVKLEEKPVHGAEMDSFDDLFGIDSTDGSSCQELVDWRLEYDAALKWCTEAEIKVEKLRTPGEYIVLVDRQHDEIEGMIQTFTSYETTVSKILDKGQRLDADTLRLSKDERTHLKDDLQSLKTKWDELQEKAFDTERSLNEHLNKLQEFQDWTEKASALSQWLEMTHRKLDCCSSPSEDLDEKSKQKLFLQKFVMEKHQNEESIKDVLNLGRYIVTNQLVLKDKHAEVNNDVKNFKDVWTQMLSKAEEFCKLFGVEFSHIDPNSSDPLDQWKRKVRDLEKWIADANDRLSLKKNLKDFSVLKTLPEDAKEISQGIDTYCVPQLNEIITKAQDILNSKKYNPIQNAEITDTLARLSERINDLRQYSESQKIHVRNATLAFFNEKLNASEAVVESVLEDLKKLKSVGTQASAVRDQVDLIKNSEDNLHKHLLEFEESKKQILEMEDKGYLSSDGFEGTLKVKTTELEPKLLAVEKQFSDTKNKLTKGVISFHGQHKDEVKKWLRYCERKLNEIDSDTDDVYEIYEAYCKLQELRREMIKGEQSFLNTLELNERLIAEAMLNEKQGQEYQSEIQAVAKWRNQLQRRIQEKDSRLYVSLVQGLNGMLTPLIHSFEVAKTTIKEQQLSGDFDTATEQMDGAKRVVESIEALSRQAQETLDLSQKITTMGILILKENDKTDVQGKVKELKEYCNVLPGKSREEFNRLYDEYLVLFKKEIGDRKNWIAVSENRMSSNYYDTEDLAGFQDELREHKDFEQELDNRNMDKMADAAERVTELDKNLKMEVRNLDKRWKVLKQWADDYSLDLQRVVIEWSTIQEEQRSLVEWLDPHEEQISKLNEKINLTDADGMKQQIVELKKLQSELEEKGVVLSNTHVKGMALMKFLNDEAAASRTIDQDLAQLDRRWNAMAKDILGRTELLRDIGLKQEDIKRQKDIVNVYIDETNAELDEHETKSQQLRGNISPDMIKENGETSREKKLRMKKDKEILRQDVLRLTKSLESKISDFPNYQYRVTRINDQSKDLEDASDNDSKVVLHEELVTFNARWQVIVTRLEDYSDYDLPEQTSWGCMGFVKRRLSNQL